MTDLVPATPPEREYAEYRTPPRLHRRSGAGTLAPIHRPERRMPVADLSHYLVRANDIEATKNFYVNVLGFEVMPRPNLPFPGYWVGVGGNIQVHIAQHGVALGSVYYLGTPPNAATDHAGVIDHIAFTAADPKSMAAVFDASGTPYRARFMEDSALYQLFVTDPNGICIELNFFGVTDAAEWADGDVEMYSEMPRS